jgi:23S rRNA pseudouridine2605 synthase
MESNRRPGKGTPKKKSPTDKSASSSRPKKTATGRSGSRPKRSDEEVPRPRALKSNDARPLRLSPDKPFSEGRPRRTDSVDRPARRSADKPGYKEERPVRSESSDRPVRRNTDKPGFDENRPRRSSSTDRPLRREDKHGAADEHPRQSASDRPARRYEKDKPGSGEERVRRASSVSRASRDENEKPAYGEGRPARSSNDRPFRKDPDKSGNNGDRPYRSSSTDRPYRSSKASPEDDNRPYKSSAGGRPERKSNPKPTGNNSGEGLIRLNKYIANSGICSRREADELILAGTVVVNGKVVTELGTKVSPTDKVQYDNHTIRSERHVYLLLNKPKGYITTTDDPFDRKTVMTLVANAVKERIYPVGRLDRNTTGLLLLTNDGEMAKKLTHPRHKVKKVYQVELDKPLTKNDMLEIAGGVELEDGIAQIDEIAYTSDGSSKREIGVELHSGKNRIVRRIFEAMGYDVVKLDRVIFAGLTKKDLPRGHWRLLTEQEVNYLKMLK